MFSQPPLRNYPTIALLLVLFALMMFSASLLSFISMMGLHSLFGIENASDFIQDAAVQKAHPAGSLFFQSLTSSIGLFLLPALVFSQLYAGNVGSLLKLNSYPNRIQLLLALATLLAAAFFISALVDGMAMLEKIPGEGWQTLMKSFRNQQALSEELVDSFFQNRSIGWLLLMLFCIGILPGIAEEMFFRGVLQQLLQRTRLGVTGGIVMSALVFAAVHFQFFNLPAMWLLGILLGFIYYYTGSLWTSIACHAFNNMLSVFLRWTYEMGWLPADLSEENSLPFYISLAAALPMIFFFKKLQQHRTTEVVVAAE